LTVQRLASDKSDAGFRVYRVTFADGGRTNWHRHAGPQWLFVIEGRIRVQTEGGAVQDLEVGDTALIAPGERHWHGAVPGSMGTHIAVNLSVSGPTVWMERVSNNDYRG
jgi:quercetin dioxygenase-like cupin family protein